MAKNMHSIKNDYVARIEAVDPSDCLLNTAAVKILTPHFSWNKDTWIQGQFSKKRKTKKMCIFVPGRAKGTWFAPTGIIPRAIEIFEKGNHKYEVKNTGFTVPSTDPVLPGLTLRRNQEEAIAAATKAGRGVLQAATAAGKCLGFNTPVLMYDGTIKMVQDIKKGDFLMGPDSSKRRVESVASGKENMYRLIPKDGSSPYTVNESHILSLIISGTKEVSGYAPGVPFNIEMRDYLKETKTFKHCAKSWRTGVLWEKRNLQLDPYFFGLWLGDGGNIHLNSIFTPDKEIKDYLTWFADSWNMKLTVSDSTGCERISIVNHRRGEESNQILDIIRNMGVQKNKHVPHNYKTSSIRDRLELLAGIIDTDGHVDKHGYDFITKYERFAHDVVFLARSVGLSARVCSSFKKSQTMCENKEYFRVFIGGDAWKIPCKVERKKLYPHKKQKDVTRYGFDVEPIGVGDYYGFEISGKDRLFLLGDFTVTHNTVLSYGIFQAYLQANKKGNKCLFIAHTVDLVHQAAKEFKDLGAKVGIWQGDTKTNGNIICTTIQTIHNMGYQYYQEEFLCIIVDECFHKDTPIRMSSGGIKKISDIVVGDSVQTSTGQRKVTNVFQSLVPLERVCRVKLSNGETIFCSVDHVFITPEGEVKAKDLTGKEIGNYENIVRILRKKRRRKKI